MKNIKSAQHWKFFCRVLVFYDYTWVQCMEIALDWHFKGLAPSSSSVTTLLIYVYFGPLWMGWRASVKLPLDLNIEGGNKKFSRILFPSPLQTVLTKGKQEGTGETKGKRNRRERKVQVACSCGPPTSGASSWDRITSNLPHPSRDSPFVLKFCLHFAHPYPSCPTPSYLRSLTHICLF